MAKMLFQKGKVANPAGRPKGIKNKVPLTIKQIRESIAALVPEATVQLAMILRSKKGNTRDKISAIKLIYDNVLPSLPPNLDVNEVAAEKMIDAIRDSLLTSTNDNQEQVEELPEELEMEPLLRRQA